MEIIVETYVPYGEASSAEVRVRPLPGQGFDTGLNVACSRAIREQFPVGSLLRMAVKMNYRNGTPYLYVHYAAPFEHVSVDEARRFIAVMFSSRPTGHVL
jgi:hypothetical protein